MSTLLIFLFTYQKVFAQNIHCQCFSFSLPTETTRLKLYMGLFWLLFTSGLGVLCVYVSYVMLFANILIIRFII